VTESKTRVAAPLTAAALIAQQVGGNAIRDGLFLSLFPVQSLPRRPESQRDLSKDSWGYLLPFVPGVALALFGRGRGLKDRPTSHVITLVAFAVALFLGVAWLNAHTARRHQPRLMRSMHRSGGSCSAEHQMSRRCNVILMALIDSAQTGGRCSAVIEPIQPADQWRRTRTNLFSRAG
jgi:hypothetical protein